MNKKILIVAAVFLLIGGGATYGLLKQNTKQSGSTTGKQSQGQIKTPSKACDIFTLDDAKKVAGNDVKQVDEAELTKTSTANIINSGCKYIWQRTADKILINSTATIEVNYAQDKSGEQIIKTIFEGRAKYDIIRLDIYGNAFWRSAANELSILKQTSLVTINIDNTPVDTTIKPGSSTPKIPDALDDAKRIADLLKTKI